MHKSTMFLSGMMTSEKLEKRFRARKAAQEYDIKNGFMNPSYAHSDFELKYSDEIES